MKDLLEGLPIEMHGDSATVDYTWKLERGELEAYAANTQSNVISPLFRLGARYLLQRMDELDPAHHYVRVESRPKWEPGTVLIGDPVETYGIWWLDEFQYKTPNGEVWKATSMARGSRGQFVLRYGNYAVHRLPYQFEVGDWFETPGCHAYKCSGYDDRTDSVLEEHGRHPVEVCRHVPPPKESNPVITTGMDVSADPFTGPHWKQEKTNAEMGFTDARCILDLAMMQRGQYVSIVDFEDRIHKLEERM